MCQGGQIGGILGSLGAGALDILFPAAGIPLSLAAGLGGAGGTFLGDIASGKSAGASILPSLETGAISGALAGAGNVLGGGSFFGAPASTLTDVVGSTAPTGAATATDVASAAAAAPAVTDAAAAAAPTAAVPTLASTTAPATIGGTTTASAAGAPAAGGIGGAVTDISGTLPTTTGGISGANLGGSAIGAGGVPLSGSTGTQLASAGVSDASSGLTGGEVLNASNTVPLGTPLNAANVNALNATPADFGGGSDIGGGAAAATRGPYGITNPAFTDANINAAWNKAATAGDGGWFSSLFKAQPGGSFLSKGLAGEPGSIAADLTKPSTLITGGAALLPLMMGNTIPGLSNLQNQAKTFNTIGTPLAESLTTGNLPAGAQSSLDAATRAAKAAVRSQYAQMGLSGSSQEADQLAGVDAREATQKVAMLEDMTKIGQSYMQQASPLLTQIMTTQLAQDQQQQQAIARLAAALAGSTGTEKTTA